MVETIAWWDKLTNGQRPIKQANVMHCLCQEAFMYESTRLKPNILRLFWICNAASSEIVKTQQTSGACKYLEGWKKRVQEYGEKMKPLLAEPGFSKEARDVGVLVMDTAGSESDYCLSGIEDGYAVLSTRAAPSSASAASTGTALVTPRPH